MTSSWESSQRSKGGLEQLNIFLVVQTLEHSVLPWLGPSPGCTWAEFNPQIGLYKRKGWARRAPGLGRGEEPSPGRSQSADQVAAPLKFHAGPVMLPNCSPTPSLEGGQVLTPPTSPLFLSLEAHGREAGRRTSTQIKNLSLLSGRLTGKGAT